MIPVDCAVNDDYGTTINRINAIHFPGLELSAIDIAGVHFRDLGINHGERRIRISRKEYGVRHLASCVGNIFWERYGMDGWTAAKCLRDLRQSKRFTPDGGFDELYRWWESGLTDDGFVRNLLIDAAKDV